MSYNTPETAAALLGTTVSQELLDNARAIIDAWTPFRWEETGITETLSGTGRENRLFLNMPIVAVDSLAVDGIERTAGVDFEVMKPLGIVVLRWTPREACDNIEVTYRYGYTSDDTLYPMVRGAEARIALYLKKNPAFLDEIVFTGTGTRVTFDKQHIKRYLSMIPTVPECAR